MPEILKSIIPPEFPDHQILITEFGAIGDSLSGNCDAFREGIHYLAEAGGGTLVVAAGHYFIDGPIHLQTNIHVHIEKGARIFFSDNPQSYLPVVKVR